MATINKTLPDVFSILEYVVTFNIIIFKAHKKKYI